MTDALMIAAALLFLLAGALVLGAGVLFVRLRSWEAVAFLWKRRRNGGRKRG